MSFLDRIQSDTYFLLYKLCILYLLFVISISLFYGYFLFIAKFRGLNLILHDEIDRSIPFVGTHVSHNSQVQTNPLQ